MRLAPVLAALALGGCAFDLGGAPLDDGGVISGDGGDPDATSTGDAGCDCALGCESDGTTCLTFDPSNLADFSLLDGVTDALTLTPGNWTIDTDAGTLRDPGNATVQGLAWATVGSNPEIEVLAVGRLDVSAAATVQIKGERALLILSDGPIVIDGTLALFVGCDTVSLEDRDRQWCGGPGGGDGGHPNPDNNGRIAATGCGPGGDGDAGGVTNERGGGGGGFGGIGGHGGGFDNNGSDSQGGAACGTIVLEPLRGGSGGGGTGYVANANDDNRSSGGGGGGAVQLTSRDEITVGGTIDAPGAGGAGTGGVGTGATGGDGGGGGGSGGAILLEAPTVTLEAGAIVTANGGGGGAGITVDRLGQRGQRTRVRALGGLNDDLTGGGFGAIGDSDGEEATDGADPGDGGSGGGGARGRIHVHGAAITIDVSATVSPIASEAPLFGT